MSKPRQVVAGTGSATVRIEYVRTRRVLRFSTSGSTPVELALPELIERLGIDAGDVAAPVRYLLFAAGHGQAKGGASDMVASFASEPHARQAFHQLRERRLDRGSWAELAALDHAGGLVRIGWFGTDTLRYAPASGRLGSTSSTKERRGGHGDGTMKRRRLVGRWTGMTIGSRVRAPTARFMSRGVENARLGD